MIVSRNLILLPFLLFSFSVNSLGAHRIIINFENTPSISQEIELIKNIKNYSSAKQMQSYLLNERWIDHFLIKSSFFGNSIHAFIRSKKPQYIWRDQFYLDQHLTKFTYDGGHPELMHLNMPLEYLITWVNIESKYINLLNDHNLMIKSAAFEPVIGWYLIADNSLRINLGDDLLDSTYQKLALTLKYMFENKLTPSIIDLRYKAGAALNYGK